MIYIYAQALIVFTILSSARKPIILCSGQHHKLDQRDKDINEAYTASYKPSKKKEDDVVLVPQYRAQGY